MTITYDPERKRATHVESGMAAEFTGHGPYIREGNAYFRLFWEGKEINFKGSYDTGQGKILEEFPNLPPGGLFNKLQELNEENFYIGPIGIDISRVTRTKLTDFPQILVELLHKVLKERNQTGRVSVHFRPFNLPRDEQWSVEG